MCQAGLPAGVLNVVSGFGPTAGAALASHMDVDKVSWEDSSTCYNLCPVVSVSDESLVLRAASSDLQNYFSTPPTIHQF